MSKITQDDIQRIGDEATLLHFLEEKLNLSIPKGTTLAQIALPLPLPFLGLDDTVAKQIMDCQDFSGLSQDALGERRPFLIRFRYQSDYAELLRQIAESLHQKNTNPTDLFFICSDECFQPFAFAYFKEPTPENWYAAVLTILAWTEENTHIHTSYEHELPIDFFVNKPSEDFSAESDIFDKEIVPIFQDEDLEALSKIFDFDDDDDTLKTAFELAGVHLDSLASEETFDDEDTSPITEELDDKELDDTEIFVAKTPQNMKPQFTTPFPDLNRNEKTVLDAIETPSSHIDIITNTTKIPSSKVASILLALELKGAIQQLPGKHFSKITQPTNEQFTEPSENQSNMSASQTTVLTSSNKLITKLENSCVLLGQHCETELVVLDFQKVLVKCFKPLYLVGF